MEISVNLESYKIDSPWNEEQCLQLIELYKTANLLWDPKHPHHFNIEKKNEAWKYIELALDRSPEECKHKMSVLFSSFRREKAKITRSMMNKKPREMMNKKPREEAYVSSWFGFKAMSFLLIKEKLYYNKKEKNETKKEQDTAVKQKKLREDGDLPDKKSSEVPGTSTSTHNADTSEINDEIKAFCNFVASKMKKYSEGTKSAVQEAICNVLFKADQGDYENRSHTVTSPVTEPPRVSIRQANDVQALIVKEEDIDSE